MGYNLLGGPILSYLPWRVGCILVQYACVYLYLFESILMYALIAHNIPRLVLTSTYQQLVVSQLGVCHNPLKTTLKNWRNPESPKALATLQFFGFISSMETVGAYGGPRNFKPKKPLKTFQLCLPTAAVAGLDGPCDVALELEGLRAKGPPLGSWKHHLG